MGDTYDAPNQQVVRADGSGPADEGTGGSVADDTETVETTTTVTEETVEIPPDEVPA